MCSIFRELKAEEIECRVAQISENKDKTPKGLSLILYKDARCDMNILDETVGPMNWMRDHKELKGNIYCGISIYDSVKQMWVTKWDCGKESNTESEKGESSDSFKRAGFNWGIGRELYTAPFIWVSAESTEISRTPSGKLVCRDKFHVTSIEYKSGVITQLTIESEKGGEVFNYGKKTSSKKEAPKQEVPQEEKRLIPVYEELKRIGYAPNSICKTYKIKSINDMTDEMIQNFLAQARNLPSKEAS